MPQTNVLTTKLDNAGYDQPKPVVMLKRCGYCGRFVTRDRWTVKDAPLNPTPLCEKCWRESDPGDYIW